MKRTLLLFVFAITIFITGCTSNTSSADLKTLKWGPAETKVGIIPNQQPDGKMGIWIDVNSTENIGDVVVLFENHPEKTAIQPKLITAGIPPEEISTPGDKKVEIKQLSTGKVIPVGTFKVTP